MFDIEVHRSPRLGDVEERVLVLTALGIPSMIHRDAGDFLLLVESAYEPRVRSELASYEAENRRRSRAAPRTEPAAHALTGSVLYAALLLGITFAIWNGFGPLDAYSRGGLDGARVQAGEWWRTLTALTLHVDIAHVVANVGFGMWFGYLGARQLGPGNAWLLITISAALANGLEGLFGPADHRAVGASTAVFAAIGLLTAFTWRERYGFTERWAVRWGPLVAGVVMLGWFGAQGEDGKTDVVAHVLGFALGAMTGAIVALQPLRLALRRVPQWLSGTAAITMIAAAWVLAAQHHPA